MRDVTQKLIKLSAFIFICMIIPVTVACGHSRQSGNTATDAPIVLEESGTWKISGFGSDAEGFTVYDLAVQFGAQIAIDEINAAGGIKGTLIEFCFEANENMFRLVPTDSSVDIIANPEGTLLVSLPAENGSFHADAADETTVSFVTKYKQMFGNEPDVFAAAAYDSVYLIKAVLEEAGITSDASMSEVCEAFQTALPEISFEGLTGFLQ